jgi:hypothetical protein
VAVTPDSGAVLDELPGEVTIAFNEVIAERVAGTPNTIDGALILSPAPDRTKVTWRRTRITARPSRGFRPNAVYRVELLPVITDLRQNRMIEGRVVVFTTGIPVPTGRLQGALVDWAAGRPALRNLVEAVLLPDSLPYRTLTDSTGAFDMAMMPAGEYLVYGVMDTNNDRRRGPREAYDTVRVTVADTGAASLELYAFVHDTVGPRLRQVEIADSLTLKLTFDRPLLPGAPLDTAAVSLTTEADTATRLPVLGVYTQAGLDSVRARLQAAADSARRAADSARAAGDTTRAAPAAARPPAAAPAPRPVPGAADRAARRPGATPPLDSTRAQKMLARRPLPTDVRFLRLEAPLIPDTRYEVRVTGVLGLTGVPNSSRGRLRASAPQRPQERATPADTGRARAPGDTTRRDTARTRP